MSSKRAIRRIACTGKTRFETFEEARGAMYALLRKVGGDGWPLQPYRCKFCKGFHFGHIPLEKLKARQQSFDARRAA